MGCVEFACKELEVKRELIISRCRTKEVVAKRWMIICFLYELGMNYNQIGRKVNRDHQAVMYAVKNASWDMWYIAKVWVKKYDSLMSPKKKVPNYKSSRVEVVKC